MSMREKNQNKIINQTDIFVNACKLEGKKERKMVALIISTLCKEYVFVHWKFPTSVPGQDGVDQFFH